MKQTSKAFSEAIVVGFAMFAVFFGAGNLIFPPYLGMQAGVHWFLGFLCFVIADAGLAIMSVMAMVKSSGSLDILLNPLGKKTAKLMSVILILCIGPLVAIPRTCATTFEMGILPLFPGFNPWIFGLIFFGIVALLTIRPTAVVDIIGKFLTPVLLVTLAVLCVKGITSPIDSIAPTRDGFNVAKEGFLAGYQTMDVLGAIPLTIVIMKSVSQKGHLTRKAQYGVMIPSSIVAFIGLFAVYGGLCYLGATTSLLELGDINQTGLVVTITELLLRRLGVVLLGLIVFFACLTTAVGLTSSSAEFFSEVFRGKISYKALVLIICGMGLAISNIGISTIIKLASPLLTVIYPVMLTQVVLSFFSDRIRNVNVFRGAVLGALVIAVLDTLADLGVAIPFIKQLPLAGVGFAWLLPAVIGGVIGCFLRSRKSAEQPQPSDI
ncbi:MAG: branched-chain amino acid transport system II carrier protein [Clostridia bacterium]|nr:branched-chain amino acid transport system II carrier protein [Clostridia bacterium]